MKSDTVFTQLSEAEQIIEALQAELAETNRGLVALTLELEERVEERVKELRAAHSELQLKNSDLLRLTTDLESANRRVQEANRLKSEFLASMSHELRTPLNAIIGFSELLLDGKTGPLMAQQKDLLNDIWTSGKHLLQLINDLLDLAKIEAGKMTLDLETFSLRKAIGEVCTIMKPAAAKKKISINTTLSLDLDLVTLDQRKFKQILYNLLSNAVKFSHDQGQIELTVGGDGLDTIRLLVRDFGIGIKKEDLPRLFTQFEQLDSGAAQLGTGLGLALTKSFVELHSGAIAVESEAGQGTSFEVKLPVSVDKAS